MISSTKNKFFDYCQKAQFSLIAVFFLTLPYNISNSLIGTLSLLIFLCSFNSILTDFKKIINEKVIMFLFAFIIFTYLSVLWSGMPLKEGDFNTNFDRFKYYFLIFPGIYFSHLDRSHIKRLLGFVALSPLISIIIYYSNALGFSDIYGTTLPRAGDNPYLRHYLIQNFFILFSSLYLYIHIFDSFKNKNLKFFTIYLTLFLFVSITLFIDPRTDARLINLGFFVMLITVPLFYLTSKVKILIIVPLLLISTIFITTNKNIQTGLEKLHSAITTQKFTGSWGARLAFAIVGMKIFYEDPILGVSINDVSKNIVKIKTDEPKYYCDQTVRIHNGHINFLAQIGLVGYSFFLFVIFQFYRLQVTNKEINVFKQATIIILLFLMVGEHYFSVKPTTNFIAILFSLFVLYAKLEREEQNTFNK